MALCEVHDLSADCKVAEMANGCFLKDGLLATYMSLWLLWRYDGRAMLYVFRSVPTESVGATIHIEVATRSGND